MKKLIFLCSFLAVAFGAVAQTEIVLGEIADSLAANASSVVRLDRTSVKVDDMTSADVRYTRVVTVLNRENPAAGWFSCSCDNTCKLTKFKGTVFDRNGKKVRDIKKSDLSKTEYSPYLASDSYAYFYELYYAEYPYTVLYEWEEKYTDGIVGFPDFAPVRDYRQSVEKADYSIEVPSAMGLSFKTFNSDGNKLSVVEETGKNGMSVALAGCKAFVKEPFSASLNAKVPRVSFAPKSFVFEKTSGSLGSWAEMGNWNASLRTGRTELPEETKRLVHQLTDSCRTMKGKVRVLYDHLAATTRYVNISLGIGGFQPMPAEKVASLNFSDCKGLSNYMCAMLEEAGVPCHYATISTVYERLYPDFPSFRQLNHVVACAVLPNDTVWLECTNPQLPFGYVHSGIAGHDAVLVQSGGSKVVRLPALADSLGFSAVSYVAEILPDGLSRLNVREHYTLQDYEVRRHLLTERPDKINTRIRDLTGASDGVVSNLTVGEERTERPSLRLEYTLESHKLARKSGTRLFVPVNAFRKGVSKFVSRERVSPYVFGHEQKLDSITIHVPEGYVVESLPGSVKIESPCLDFESKIHREGDCIYVCQQLLLKAGTYPVGQVPDFEADFNRMVTALNATVVLKKTAK